LEVTRKDLTGHSRHLARQAAMVARRLGLAPKEVSHLSIAAYLHDLGKPEDRHHTLASLTVNPEWKASAKASYRAPIKLFEAVRLPPSVNTMLAQLYEAYDGSGVPQGVKSEEIILGARVLAAVDAYLDLMKNPRNALGRLHTRDEALAHLTQHAGTLYDPVVVDIISNIHSGELLRQRLRTEGRQIVVADPEEAVRTDLRDSLTRRGLVTQTLSTFDGAVDAALAGEADVMVVGLRLGLRELRGLVELLRSQPSTTSLPVVVLGQPPDAPGRQALAQIGVNDVLGMPLEPEEAATHIIRHYEDRILHGGPARVVRGGLDEMSQADLLRELGKAKKSGRLTLRSDGREGHYHIEQGKVVFATFQGQTGASAVRAMFALKDAEFAYDADSLLLEQPHLSADVELMLKELSPKNSASRQGSPRS